MTAFTRPPKPPREGKGLHEIVVGAELGPLRAVIARVVRGVLVDKPLLKLWPE